MGAQPGPGKVCVLMFHTKACPPGLPKHAEKALVAWAEGVPHGTLHGTVLGIALPKILFCHRAASFRESAGGCDRNGAPVNRSQSPICEERVGCGGLIPPDVQQSAGNAQGGIGCGVVVPRLCLLAVARFYVELRCEHPDPRGTKEIES